MQIYSLKSQIRKICEIGAGDIKTSRSFCFWSNKSIKIEVFEPNPIFYRNLMNNSFDKENVRVHNCAVSKTLGFGELYLIGYNSYLKGVFSQIECTYNGRGNDFYKERLHPVPLVKSNVFDAGDIDILFLSCNGCECDVIRFLKSRPKIIYLCYQNQSGYTLPNMNNILEWLKQNNYGLLPYLQNHTMTQKKLWFAKYEVIKNREIIKLNFDTEISKKII